MARDLAFPPGRQRFVEVAQDIVGLLVERRGLLFHVHLGVAARQRAQFLGLAFDFGQGFFEVEIVHWLPPPVPVIADGI
jgi:hypothetical protein